jgi:hypothetical protein
MTEMEKALWFVERYPMADSIRKALNDNLRISSEPLDTARIEPSSLVFDILRKIPVKQCDPWLNICGKKLVDESIIKVETRLIDPSGVVENDPRPSDREPIGR